MINKHSEYFSAPFWDSQFFDYKENISVNFPQNTSKQQTSIVFLYVAHLEEKNNFFLYTPILLVWLKTVV